MKNGKNDRISDLYIRNIFFLIIKSPAFYFRRPSAENRAVYLRWPCLTPGLDFDLDQDLNIFYFSLFCLGLGLGLGFDSDWVFNFFLSPFLSLA